MNEKQQALIEDKQTTKIRRLEEQILRLKEQKAKLKERNEKLKAQLAKKDLAYKKLQQQLVQEGKIKDPPVKRLHSRHPELAKAFSQLCREWNLKTMNTKNTTMAILRIIEPDDNGVVEYTEQDVINYITILRRLGRNKYMQNPTLAEYYEPYDSLVLFKHYKMIRRNLLQWLNPKKAQSEQLGFKTGNTTLNGIELKPIKKTAVCTWEDLRNQHRGVSHVNDVVSIEEFKGDDLVRERERRQLKVGGVYDEEAVRERIKYQAERYWGEDKITEQIINETPIVDEDDDDDIDISEFKEVK